MEAPTRLTRKRDRPFRNRTIRIAGPAADLRVGRLRRRRVSSLDVLTGPASLAATSPIRMLPLRTERVLTAARAGEVGASPQRRRAPDPFHGRHKWSGDIQCEMRGGKRGSPVPSSVRSFRYSGLERSDGGESGDKSPAPDRSRFSAALQPELRPERRGPGGLNNSGPHTNNSCGDRARPLVRCQDGAERHGLVGPVATSIRVQSFSSRHAPSTQTCKGPAVRGYGAST